MKEVSVIFNSVTLLTDCVDSGGYTAIKRFLVFRSVSCRAFFFLPWTSIVNILFSMHKIWTFLSILCLLGWHKAFWAAVFFRRSQQHIPFCVCSGVAWEKKQQQERQPLKSLLYGVCWALLHKLMSFWSQAWLYCGSGVSHKQQSSKGFAPRGRIWAAPQVHAKGPSSLQMPVLVGLSWLLQRLEETVLPTKALWTSCVSSAIDNNLQCS